MYIYTYIMYKIYTKRTAGASKACRGHHKMYNWSNHVKLCPLPNSAQKCARHDALICET